jgi:hypothetical protein
MKAAGSHTTISAKRRLEFIGTATFARLTPSARRYQDNADIRRE